MTQTSAIAIIVLMWLYWATDFVFKIAEGGRLSLRIVARGCVLAAWTAFAIVAWRHYRANGRRIAEPAPNR